MKRKGTLWDYALSKIKEIKIDTSKRNHLPLACIESVFLRWLGRPNGESVTHTLELVSGSVSQRVRVHRPLCLLLELYSTRLLPEITRTLLQFHSVAVTDIKEAMRGDKGLTWLTVWGYSSLLRGSQGPNLSSQKQRRGVHPCYLPALLALCCLLSCIAQEAPAKAPLKPQPR